MHDNIVVKNKIADLLAFARLVSLRRKTIKAASPECLPEDPVNRMAREMHPQIMHLLIDQIVQETETTRTFTLKPDIEKGTRKLATFMAGQYLNVRVPIDGKIVARNYSLSSTPQDAADGFYRITVREKKNGYATEFIFGNWKAGTEVESSGPVGTFGHETLRDKQSVVAITGGCGITPIYSMVKDATERENGVSYTVLYGIRNSRDIIFKKQLEELEKKYGKFVKIHYIASEPDEGWTGAKGFITAKLIKELVGDTAEKSYFVCGPQAMYAFLDGELEELNLPSRLIRREVFGEADEPTKLPGFPSGNASKTYELKVHIADSVIEIKASGADTLLVSLERAGVEPPSRCRSGECGFCRAKLISGEVYVSPTDDGRRIADKKFNWIHPCSSYPLSNIEIRVNRAK